MSRKHAILAGIIGRFPVGGVTWCALQYIKSLQELGYSVFYLEDTGECNYDPTINGISENSTYATAYIKKELRRVGLEDSWSYIDFRGQYHGQDRARVRSECERACFLLNLSGGCWFAREEYEGIPKVFVDSDPGFTQRAIVDAGPGWYRDLFASYHALFTFALNIDRDSCLVAKTDLQWHPTIQPLVASFWPYMPMRAGNYTTIMSWKTDSFPGMEKGKAEGVLALLDFPKKCPLPVELAIAGNAPLGLLQQHGWNLTDAVRASATTDLYQAYIQRSRGELGFAKAMYVETRSGWFSDRTQCYLASGKPAIVRDTDFHSKVPVGEGLFAFRSCEDILASMDAIESAYERHSRAARDIAQEYFRGDRVVKQLLQAAGL